MIENYFPAWFDQHPPVDFKGYRVGPGIRITVQRNRLTIRLPYWMYRWLTSDGPSLASTLRRGTAITILHGYVWLTQPDRAKQKLEGLQKNWSSHYPLLAPLSKTILNPWLHLIKRQPAAPRMRPAYRWFNSAA